MERIGTSDIWVVEVDPSEDYAVIRVPVPPSTNNRQTIGYRKIKRMITGARAGFVSENTPVLVKTSEAREYEDHIPFIRMALKIAGVKMHRDYVPVDFWFTLKNLRYDTHNGLKIMCDVLEKSGLVTDDRFILPQIQRPEFSTALPHLDIGVGRNN